MGMQNVTENLFELQFKNWDTVKYKNKMLQKTENQITELKHPVITISSQSGIDIRSIAPMLVRELELDLFDSDIVDLIAQNAHLSRQMVETLDEKSQSALEDWLAEEIFDDEFTSKVYLRNLRAVVFTIAAHGNAVIIGRGAAFMIKPVDRLALRLVAPLEQRLKLIEKEQCLTEQESREYIDKIAQRHRSFVKKHFHADVEDPVNYSLVINTALVQPMAILEIVKTVRSMKHQV